jgi:septal ring factor EnvC (AmiA/AmiB activator)
VERHERKLEKLAQARSELEKQLSAPELYLPAARAQLQSTLDKQKELERQSAEAEAAWLDASTRLEAASGASP